MARQLFQLIPNLILQMVTLSEYLKNANIQYIVQQCDDYYYKQIQP